MAAASMKSVLALPKVPRVAHTSNSSRLTVKKEVNVSSCSLCSFPSSVFLMLFVARMIRMTLQWSKKPSQVNHPFVAIKLVYSYGMFVDDHRDDPIEISSTEAASNDDDISLAGVNAEADNAASDDNGSDDDAYAGVIRNSTRLSSESDLDLDARSSASDADSIDGSNSLVNPDSDTTSNVNNDIILDDDINLESDEGYGPELIGRVPPKHTGEFNFDDDDISHPVIAKKPCLVSS